MTDARVSYLGSAPRSPAPSVEKPLFRRVPIGFVVVVVLPTLIALIYFLLIASPRYVSESRFVVRSPARAQPSALNLALSGVGLSGSSDSFAVHEYLTSRDGLTELARKMDVRGMYSRPGVDAFSRLPHPFSDRSFETFHKQFNGYVTVGYDSQTGISTLRVQAFTARDAVRINDALLKGGEGLVNRLNDRSARDAVVDAERAVVEANAKLNDVQGRLTVMRNTEGFIDPARSAQAGGEVVGELTVRLAMLRAERSQMAADTPNNPQLPVLDSSIRAYEQQIEAERAKIVGGSGSLALKLSDYENLVMEREYASKYVATATATLNEAQIESRRQRLYLERIVNPNLPDEPSEPRRWISIFAVFASALIAYLTGTLVWAGLRESRSGG